MSDNKEYEFTELGREAIKAGTDCYCFACGRFIKADIYNQCKECESADAIIRVSDALKLGWIKEKRIPRKWVIEGVEWHSGVDRGMIVYPVTYAAKNPHKWEHLVDLKNTRVTIEEVVE